MSIAGQTFSIKLQRLPSISLPESVALATRVEDLTIPRVIDIVLGPAALTSLPILRALESSDITGHAQTA